jgi:hypothetical protein
VRAVHRNHSRKMVSTLWHWRTVSSGVLATRCYSGRSIRPSGNRSSCSSNISSIVRCHSIPMAPSRNNSPTRQSTFQLPPRRKSTTSNGSDRLRMDLSSIH